MTTPLHASLRELPSLARLPMRLFWETGDETKARELAEQEAAAVIFVFANAKGKRYYIPKAGK